MSMNLEPEATSAAFESFAAKKHAPVVMQILPALNSGGVEQGVIDISAAVIRAGGQSIVVSSGGARVHEITRLGGLHVDMPVHSKNPFTIAANILRLRRLIRRMNVDVVHACSRAPAWSAGRAVQGTSARYVTSVHSAHKITGELKRLYNAALTKGERVIAVSHSIADYLEKNYTIDPARIRVVHRGVSLGRFHPNSVTPDRLIRLATSWRIPDGAPVILLPARLTRIKGHMFLLDALQNIAGEEFFCVFVGADPKKGGFRQDLEKSIEARGLSGKVRIVSHCDDMPAAYMLSTVVTSPSLVPEGFGRIAIEAQAMGRPLIATDHGGAQETVVRDETGWLVMPDDVGGLTRALREALSLSPASRARLATRAMAHIAAHFTNERMAAGTLDVYAELLNEARAAALPSNDTKRLAAPKRKRAG